MAGSSKFACFLLFAALAAMELEAHNITAILEAFPEYSLYNNYLTKTRLSDEINTHSTVTVLALTNANMSSLASNHNLVGIKNALRLLTLLDYFDFPKLQSLTTSTVSTTLLQTTGAFDGNSGFLNITNLSSRIEFSPVGTSSKLESFYTKSVKQLPYNISVLEISAPIIFPGLMKDTNSGNTNLTALLEKAGCKKFVELLESSSVMEKYDAQLVGGPFTLFAPKDEAFEAHGVPNLNSLSKKVLSTVLLYHALPSYIPIASLKAETGNIRTLASDSGENFELSVRSNSDEVTIFTGVYNSRVTETVLDSVPVCVMTVDNLLFPVELLGNAPAPAPSQSH